MSKATAAIETVSAHRQIRKDDILSHDRYRPYVYARQEAQYVLRVISGKSLPEIGRVFDRDHTTIIHSLSAVESRMRSDAYRGEIEEMMRDAWARAGAFTSTQTEKVVFSSVRSESACS